MKNYYKEMTKVEAIELATENIIDKMNSYETNIDVAINTELENCWQLTSIEIEVSELNVNKILQSIDK